MNRLPAHRERTRLVVLALACFSACLSGPSALAEAASLPLAAGNLFTQALREGEATAPAPAIGLFDGALHSLQQQAGDSGTIYVKARRVVRFPQQSHCGRVAFALYQPSSNHAWPALGGQLNICEDGLPPLRVCNDRPEVLVPAAASCKDKSAPRDTAEVSSAIAASLSSGDITPEQARQRQLAERSRAQPPTNTGKGGSP